MDIDIIRPSDLSSAEIERWTALQSADPELASPFLAAYWPRAVERAQTSTASGVRVAILHEGGAVRGFFSAKIQGQTAMPAGAPMCDYQGVVAEAGAAVDARRLVDAFGVARYDFTHMPASQATLRPIRAARPRRGRCGCRSATRSMPTTNVRRAAS